MSTQDRIFQKLDIVFRKGRMGPTISREVTAERVNALLEQHMRLNHSYAYAIRELDDRRVAEELERTQRDARADVGKLKETVFSAGATAHNGTEFKEGNVELGNSDDEILHALHDREKDFGDALAAEGDIAHQMRTRAIIGAVRENSNKRLHDLKGFVKGRRRPHTS